MNNYDAHVKELNDNWTYKYDIDQYAKKECWKIMHSAPYLGDCEDYSLTLLFNICDKSYFKFWWSLITRKAKIDHVGVYGNGHAVLRYEGRHIDNIQRKWCTKKDLESKGYNFSKSWLLYGPYGVAVKLLHGKIKWQSK
jgi:hypothetical protein|tara:strand:+ start:161 stop:577 length:417 start_codon:yes stop_codon:yes gene_type:complete